MSLIKKSLIFSAYSFLAVMACALAFMLALQFMNPSRAEEEVPSPQAQEVSPSDLQVQEVPKNSEGGLISKIKSQAFGFLAKVGLMKAPPSPTPALENQALEPQADQLLETPSPDAGNDLLSSPVSSEEGENPSLGQEDSSDKEDSGSDGGVDSEIKLEIESYMAKFVYSPKAKDPFDDPTSSSETFIEAGLIQEEDQEPLAPTIVKEVTPPERFELDQIHLKGIIWDTKTPKALFQLPGQGGYYTLLKGDKIGKTGIIFAIRESEVVIVENLKVGSENPGENVRIKVKAINRVGDVLYNQM